jgi:uncharacterized protein (TIGR02246 family)
MTRTPRAAALAASVATLVLVSACASDTDTDTPTTAPTSVTTEKVAALFDEWNAALATGDPAVVAARYTPDAVLLPTVSDEVRDTPELITSYFTKFLAKSPVGTIDQSAVRVLDDGIAKDVGVYTFALTGDDGTVEQVQARYSFVYELVDGEWLITHHHSSAMPEV